MSANQDQELHWVRQTAQGDRTAFEQLYRAYQRRVFGYLFRMMGSAANAEEVTADVMVEVWKVARTFRGDSKVSTWIFGIARFKGLSVLRRARTTSVDVEEAVHVADPGELQDEALVRQSMKAGIREALGKLSKEHREVMELTFFEGFSYPEIAKLIDCPVGTVKTRMFHARKQLRDLLQAEVTP
jgi:RNA polymerase sigma-70 factor (ECF subfamily)